MKRSGAIEDAAPRRFAAVGAHFRAAEGRTIRTALLVAAVALATAAAVLSGVGAMSSLSLARIGTAVGAAVALTLYLVARERRRHEAIAEQLATQAAFLESLVASMGQIASSLDAQNVLEQARVEAERLFQARATLVRVGAGANGSANGRVLDVPVHVRGQELALRLERDAPFERTDIARATVLADFAARSSENARLFAEAQVREAERSQLADQIISAEQDERRRLANELHDGAVQSLSGIALMLDATQHAVEDGRTDDAQRVLENALERHRETIRSLRDLSFNLEPVVLRDQGFTPAVRALAEQLGVQHQIQFHVDVEAAEALGEKTQAALYQIIRQALTHAIRRGPPTRVTLRARPEAGGEVELLIADDAPGERRRASYDEIAERARTLNGRLDVEGGHDGGTTVRVAVPPYAAAG